MFHVPDKYRVRQGSLASDEFTGNAGAFIIPRGMNNIFSVIASDGEGWEHVSVHCTSLDKERIPTWSEMCFIKNIFWDKEDVVIQYHPKETEYVDHHKFTLHMWKPIGVELPTPPIYMV
jgi:hypothetical protein